MYYISQNLSCHSLCVQMWRINFVQVIKDSAVSGADQRSVAQVGGVSGAGGYSERCRSDLMVRPLKNPLEYHLRPQK